MARWLSSGGVNEIILAVNHLSDKLKVDVGHSIGDVTVAFSVEEKPLGTAGPIRLAANLLTKDDPFLVINGDIVSDIDIRKMLAAHKEKKADATIALVSVPDPSPYGSVLTDPEGVVRRFAEKSGTISSANLVNAGVYVISPSVVGHIPIGRPVSLERDVFPRLAENGGMHAWIHNGFWYDIGRVSEYVRTNKELLEKEAPEGGSTERGAQYAQYERHILHPAYVGAMSRLGVGAKVGPFTILSNNVTVGDDAIVRNSIVFEETVIGEKTIVEDAVIGERVVIGRGSRIGRGSIIAGQLSIAEGSIVPPDSVILC
jgi:NDP-sugar pyrophosphorylase family protein